MRAIIYTRLDELQDHLLDIEEELEFYGETEALVQERNQAIQAIQAWQLVEPQKDKWLRELRVILQEMQNQENEFGEETGSYYQYLKDQRDDLVMQIQNVDFS